MTVPGASAWSSTSRSAARWITTSGSPSAVTIRSRDGRRSQLPSFQRIAPALTRPPAARTRSPEAEDVQRRQGVGPDADARPRTGVGPFFDHSDGMAALLKRRGGRQAGDAGTDDDDLGHQPTISSSYVDWEAHMTDTSDWFAGFTTVDHQTGDVTIHARVGGRADAPPLVLLHGFPQNHTMWHRIARQLAPHFRLVLPDLRGYGDSGKPPGGPGHVNYSKRTMANDIAELMRALGHDRYAVCGHDRGGRVAHRLAVDHPAAVTRLAVIDIAPTLDMYEATDMRFATFYYHWFHLIQPSPLPETMIGGDPLFYLHWSLGGWGSDGLAHIEPEALGVLRALLR